MSCHTSNRIRRVLRVEKLDDRLLLARDTVYISEFLANNDSVLTDEDGQFSDWVELHNPTPDPVDLAGWSLTGAAGELDKWTFPRITIPADGYQVIFASGKNRREPTEELHTNFKLATDGEYLALVTPNQTIAHDFNPAYPPQSSDVSYGFASNEIPIVASDAIRSFQAPTENDSQEDAWRTDVNFDDSSWQESRGAIGYSRPGIENASFENDNLSSWQNRGPVSVVDSSFGVSPTQGQNMALATTRDSTASRAGVEFYLDLPRSSLDKVNVGGVQRVAALKREVVVAEGTILTFDWNFLTNDLRDGDFAFVSVSDSQTVSFLAGTLSNLVGSSAQEYSRETGFRRFSHTFTTAGTFTIGIGVAQAIDLNYESALIVDNLQIDGVGDPGPSYDSILETHIENELSDNNTVWWRQEFQFDPTEPLKNLLLRVQYDDGFAAFINGNPVASRNAPESLFWNSRATNVHANQEAVEFEEFSVSSSLLEPGKNLLAIQGLNSESDSLDFLLDAELVGVGMPSDKAEFLLRPTPGGPNLSQSIENGIERAGEVTFNHSHGFYNSSFLLSMSTVTPGLTIYYTTDGSEPISRASQLYEHPIDITSTTIVRATAFQDGLIVSATETASYLFIEDILQQSTSTATAAGFPSTWSDYEMDPDVIGPDGQDAFGGKYVDLIRDALLSLPTMSLVTDVDDLFGDQGIFDNPTSRGEEWERPTSVELFHPNETDGFQANAGLRIQGGISRNNSDKLSMRLLFQEQFGEGKLRYPLFGADGPEEFDSITLRSSAGEFLVGFHYIRDETLRRIENGTGNPSALGNFVHLYVNGLYWGVYNPTERIDAQFAVNRDGGDKEDYDIYNAGNLGDEKVTAIHGTIEAWDTLRELSNAVGAAVTESARTTAFMRLQGRNSDGSDNPALESYLDVDNFINYLLVNVYAGNGDWPHRNYYMYRRRGSDSDGFKFQVWDAEFSFDAGNTSRQVTELTHGPTIILNSMLKSEAFRVRFADRVHKLFSPSGALYVNPESPDWDPDRPDNNMPAQIYAELADSVNSAIVAESARWGDARGHRNPPFTRDEDWTTLVNKNLAEFFPQRSAMFLDQLRSDDLYRDAPAVSPLPGHVAAGSMLTLTSIANVPIYYTTDGTDPRLADGNISPKAIPYAEPIPIDGRTVIRARSLGGTKWSAIDEGVYLTDETSASSDNLRITELHYHPQQNEESEFLELTNISSQAIRLEGVTVDGGVTFDFADSELLRLGPGERLVLVRDREAFIQTYPGQEDVVAGQYNGNLSNGGEQLTLRSANGTIIQQFEYRDDEGWPILADGRGPSLQLIDSNLDPSRASSWRASAIAGGTPGIPEYQVGDSNLDGVFNSSDLVLVFQGAEYEDAIEGNSSWRTGDWTGDADFTTADFVLAFQVGDYALSSVSTMPYGDIGNQSSIVAALSQDSSLSFSALDNFSTEPNHDARCCPIVQRDLRERTESPRLRVRDQFFLPLTTQPTSANENSGSSTDRQDSFGLDIFEAFADCAFDRELDRLLE